jgi:hypothetical protein
MDWITAGLCRHRTIAGKKKKNTQEINQNAHMIHSLSKANTNVRGVISSVIDENKAY